MELSLVTKILERLAPEFGARVEVEPAWGYAGRVVFPDGRAMRFVGTHLDVNPMGAAAMATDKSYALWALAEHGLPVPEGDAFFSRAWARTIGSDRTPDAALAYAERLGFPVFVKPNSGRSGTDVHCVGDAASLIAAVRRIIRHDRVFRVERPVGGGMTNNQAPMTKQYTNDNDQIHTRTTRDLRLVVVGDTVSCAYERTPLTVVGDGTTSIAELLRVRVILLQNTPRPWCVLQQRDSRVLARLARIGRTLEDVPAMGERVQLLDNANLSSGGEARDITDTLDPALATLAVRAAHVVGLAFAGVDVISSPPLLEGELEGVCDASCATPSLSPPPRWMGRNQTTILECNAAPSLAHYAACGPQQRARTEECYRRVLALVVAERHFNTPLDTISPVCHSTNVAALGQ